MTVTLKVTKRQVLAAVAVFFLAFAAGVWGKAIFSKLTEESTETFSGSGKPVVILKAPAKTAEQRLALLNNLGWEVVPEEEVLEVQVPGAFDDVLTRYNLVQIAQGCDLNKYRSKKCTRYTYEVLNHPDDENYVRANLIVYKGKVIGGDVSSLREDGFMQTLRGEDVDGYYETKESGENRPR